MKKTFAIALLLGSIALFSPAANAQTDWSPIKVEESQFFRYGNNEWNNQKLTCTVPAEQADKGSAGGSLPIDLTPYRGKWVELSIRAKAEEVAKPKLHYMGIKFMLKYQGANQKWYYPERNNLSGSFDQELSFTHKVADDAGKGSVNVMLAQASGKITYDLSSLKIRVVPAPETQKAVPQPVFAEIVADPLSEWSQVKPAEKMVGLWGGASLTDGMLACVVPAEQADKGSAGGSFPIDLTPYRNCEIALSIRAKAENVTKPKLHYMGIKFMLKYQGADQKWYYPECNNLSGSFDKELVLRHPVAGDAGAASINMMLSQASGRITYDLSTLKIRIVSKKKNPDLICQYSDAVRNRPVHRGVMSPCSGADKEENFAELKKWNVNLMRFQINIGGPAAKDPAFYRMHIRRYIDEIIPRVLDLGQKYGVKIIIDLHMVPGGGQMRGGQTIFDSEESVAEFCRIWEEIAARFKDHPALYGYDLFNEPAQNRPAKFDYWEIQRMAAEKIRKIDPETPIYIESNMLASQYTFDTLSPINLKNIIYEVHCYDPFLYTHSPYTKEDRLAGKPRLVYPGKILNADWNAGTIKGHLDKVIAFAEHHKAKIYVGEFSARAGAPGAAQYLRDSIAVFEEQGWDWTYHAFREANIWSVEHDGPSDDELVPVPDTDRKQVLLEAFRKNLIRPENEFFCRSNVHGSVTGLKPVRKPSFENVEIESLQHEEQQ